MIFSAEKCWINMYDFPYFAEKNKLISTANYLSTPECMTATQISEREGLPS